MNDEILQACITISGFKLHRLGPKMGHTVCGRQVFNEVNPDHYVDAVPAKCRKCWSGSYA